MCSCCCHKWISGKFPKSKRPNLKAVCQITMHVVFARSPCLGKWERSSCLGCCVSACLVSGNHQNGLPADKSICSGLAVQIVHEKNVCCFLQHAQCADLVAWILTCFCRDTMASNHITCWLRKFQGTSQRGWPHPIITGLRMPWEQIGSWPMRLLWVVALVVWKSWCMQHWTNYLDHSIWMLCCWWSVRLLELAWCECHHEVNWVCQNVKDTSPQKSNLPTSCLPFCGPPNFTS